MRLDENLNYIISDECKQCVHYEVFSNGPSCIKGVPDTKCEYYKKRRCDLCNDARVNEQYHILFCKIHEMFVEEKDYDKTCASCRYFNI